MTVFVVPQTGLFPATVRQTHGCGRRGKQETQGTSPVDVTTLVAVPEPAGVRVHYSLEKRAREESRL